MAYPNKEIKNPLSGQEIRFIQTRRDTNGELLEMVSTYQPHSTEPIAHYHPFQEEEFTVLVGEVSVRVKGEVRVLKVGDSLHIPPGEVHSMWNDSDQQTVVNWKVRPAMDTEYFLETGMGLAKEGRANARGVPSLLQVAIMLNKFHPVFRLARPPFWVQRGVFGLLAPLAFLLGYRATYDRYLD